MVPLDIQNEKICNRNAGLFLSVFSPPYMEIFLVILDCSSFMVRLCVPLHLNSFQDPFLSGDLPCEQHTPLKYLFSLLTERSSYNIL